MKVVLLRTGPQKTRCIYVPDKAEKRALRKLLLEHVAPVARAVAVMDGPRPVAQGFVDGLSPVTNAREHRGYAYTLCFDLQDFFESVTADKLGRLPADVLAQVLADGAARQGLPTSPAVANIAAAPLDRALLDYREAHGLAFVYTRYADDLSFSFDDLATADLLRDVVPEIVAAHGFAVNARKTHLHRAKAGRRLVTGVAVDADLHPTRRVKRKLRAAQHRKTIMEQGDAARAVFGPIMRPEVHRRDCADRLYNQRQIRGLAEWCRLKAPKATSP